MSVFVFVLFVEREGGGGGLVFVGFLFVCFANCACTGILGITWRSIGNCMSVGGSDGRRNSVRLVQ